MEYCSNSYVSSDLYNYLKDDFKPLKITIQHCIPLIRFYDFSSKEFLYNVVPYKDVLLEELYMELLKTFLKKKVLKLNFIKK
jgi:hypothetical protein